MSRKLPGNTAPTLFGLPRSATAGIAAGLALTLAGCGETAGSGSAESASSSQAASSTAPSRTPLETTTKSPSKEIPTITFDYLNVGSTIIQVYPDPYGKSGEGIYNGTYNNGDIRPVECQIEDGRAVDFPPVTSEAPKPPSHTWYKLAGGPPNGPEHWATDVYADPTNPAVPIPECP